MATKNLIDMAWDCAIVKPRFRHVLAAIVKGAKIDSEKHLIAEISYKQIAERAGIARSTAKVGVDRLVRLGVIVVKKRSRGRGSNIYAITKKLANKGAAQ